MAYLADTNIMTRRVLPADPKHGVVSAALLTLDQQGETIYLTTHLLTLDPTDFRRYSAIITVVEPQNVR